MTIENGADTGLSSRSAVVCSSAARRFRAAAPFVIPRRAVTLVTANGAGPRTTHGKPRACGTITVQVRGLRPFGNDAVNLCATTAGALLGAALGA